MLTRIGTKLGDWVATQSPWTNVYGLARTLLAGATLLTLLCSDVTTLFRPGAGAPEFPHCSQGIATYGLFCLPVELPLLRWVAIVALAVIASGWRPRLTGVVHAWIAASYHLNATVVDGGDQINQVLTLLLIPVTLTDGRVWHWQDGRGVPQRAWTPYAKVFALLARAAVCVQMAGLYLHAAAGKFAAPQWANGTALYYWLQDGVYGAPDWLRPAVVPILRNGTTVTLLTWSVIVLEFSLAAALLTGARTRQWLLLGGFALHGGILVMQGISSFSVAMMAGLILYLRPWSEPIAFGRKVARARTWLRTAIGRGAAAAPHGWTPAVGEARATRVLSP